MNKGFKAWVKNSESLDQPHLAWNINPRWQLIMNWKWESWSTKFSWRINYYEFVFRQNDCLTFSTIFYNFSSTKYQFSVFSEKKKVPIFGSTIMYRDSENINRFKCQSNWFNHSWFPKPHISLGWRDFPHDALLSY